MSEVILPNVEEIEKIRNKDIETITLYYNKNFKRLKMYVRKFCNNYHCFDIFEDLLNEIFVNFYNLKFDSPSFFGTSCHYVFFEYLMGDSNKRNQVAKSTCGRELYILDKPIKNNSNEDGGVLGDFLSNKEDVFDVLYKKPDITDKLFNFLCQYLGKEQIRVFEQFYYTGKEYKEIAEELGKTYVAVRNNRNICFKKFREHLVDIKQFLDSNNYEFNVVL